MDRITKESGVEGYLVGGLIRDWLNGRPTRDVDLVLNRDALKAARMFAQRTGGTFVLLREEGGMARVVLKDRTFDFAEFRGPDLKADLEGRDFTVNALTLSLSQAFGNDHWEPFDPFGGLQDLQASILRPVSPDSFKRDPLRLLRAFRLSAQLGLALTPETLKAIRRSAALLNRCAPERIRYEWLLFLSQAESYPLLLKMDNTGLLAALLPELVGLKGVAQDRFHHLDAFQHSLEAFHKLEDLIGKTVSLPPDLEEERVAFLSEPIKAAWLKWAALLHDLGKRETETLREGHQTFYGHARKSQDRFDIIAERFRLGNREKDFIAHLIGWHMRPLNLLHEEAQKTLTRRAMIRLVQETEESLNGLFLLALADSLAMQGPDKPA
ncbi:MAG: HD domain-containing protein, partial [Thermodesulfobacteriota bacterium]